MTTLYRSVPIKSAEQAEALPWGTPYLTVINDGRVMEAGLVGEEDPEDLTPKGDWHSVALMPIEAEEETVPQSAVLAKWKPDSSARRLVTRWEEA